ncbi:MAG: hypothetical protein IPG44_01570 [Anaerolineales bacterium]|jgi:hypothetical protein|nr:hypothetical protein [Anaerolineales bacterium]MCC6985039.1 hypothetical protein [Anaerolineales bacterium]
MLDSQKIVIDLGPVRLDLFFGEDASAVEPVTRSSFALGVMNYSRADLEKYRSRNERVRVRVVGGFRLDDDVSPALALGVVDSIRVFGALRARDEVRDALMQSGKIL